MSTLHSEVFRFAHVSHDWLTRLTEDVERWLSSSLGISQAKLGPAGALSIFLASSSLLYFWRTRSRNQPGQGGKPPMIPYWVPWLGSALQVQRDPDALYGKAHRELGPMFGVKAFGMTRYYVADTDLINAVYKQTAAFSGSPIQSVFLQLIFAVREEVITGSNIFGDMLITKNRHLSPINVHSLVGSFIDHTRTLVEKRDSIALDTPTSLLSIAIPLMQKADCAMLFGPSFLDKHYDIAAPAFETFDANVPLLAVSFPPWLMPGTIAARTLLLDRLTQYFESDVPEDASGQLKDFVELGRSVDWSPRDLAAYALGMMWPLLANAPYAVFWFFAYHLRRPEGLAPILEEVKATVSSGRDLNEVVRDSGTTPYLDACISETIRIASDSYSVRWVPAATEVALGGFTFTGGDSVVCNMRGVHMDATIYPNPSEFEPARFLGAGKESVRGRFFPFGGGFSICEGRHFALAQIKAFIIILLSEFDVSLANEREPIPKLSPNNRGFGMIKPLGDVSVRLRPRKL